MPQKQTEITRNVLTKQGMVYDSAYRLEVYLPQLLYAEKIQSLKH